jgi:polyhydroxyalkanoate synthesis regulator phasin
MSNSLLQAFFVGRALAEVLSEKFELALTDALSELGKFDAEAREQIRTFTEEVIDRANRAAEAAGADYTSSGVGQTDTDPGDIQATIDDLRAEIATLRTELQRYRSNTI